MLLWGGEELLDSRGLQQSVQDKCRLRCFCFPSHPLFLEHGQIHKAFLTLLGFLIGWRQAFLLIDFNMSMFLIVLKKVLKVVVS